MSDPLPPNQRMFNGRISAAALADQLAARFGDRQHHTHIERYADTALVQIGSKHGTPVTVHIADTEGGVLVTMSRDRDWLDRVADASELIERAATNPVSLLALIPDAIGELKQENLPPKIWDAINDLCALTRALAGEKNAPAIPKSARTVKPRTTPTWSCAPRVARLCRLTSRVCVLNAGAATPPMRSSARRAGRDWWRGSL